MSTRIVSLLICVMAACSLCGCTDPDPENDGGAEDAGRDLPDASDDPGLDAAIDAAVDPADGAVEECDVAGTYYVSWIPASGNAEGCATTMDDTIEVNAEGFEMDTAPCPADCSTTCVRVPVSPDACMSLAQISGPCIGLAEGRTIAVTITFGETESTFSITDTMDPAAGGVCAYTGIGVRE